MPELPEVETVRRGLEPTMVGSVITKVDRKRADLRFRFPGDFDTRIEGQKVIALGRRAKYLLVDLESGDVLVMHLGMSGSFRIEAPAGTSAPGVFHHDRSKDAAHDHVTFHLSGGARIVYNDPRRFGFRTLSRGKPCRLTLSSKTSALSRSATRWTALFSHNCLQASVRR